MSAPLNKQPNSKHCFVCGLENRYGLKLAFYDDGKGQVVAETTIPEQFQGYPGVVHGGIVAAILDEIAGRVSMITDPNDFKVTAKMTLRYRSQIPIGQPLKIVGQMERSGGRAARARGEIRLPDGSVGAEVEALLVDYPETIATDPILKQLGWKVYPDEQS